MESKGQQARQKVKKKVETGQEDLKKKVDDLQKDVDDLQKKMDELLKKVDAQGQQNQKKTKKWISDASGSAPDEE